MRRKLNEALCSLLLCGLTFVAACGQQDGAVPLAPATENAAPQAQGPLLELVSTEGPAACGTAGIFCWAGSLGTPPSFHKVWGVSSSDIWIVGTQGTLLHWNGVGWSQLPSGMISVDLHGLWGSGASDIWAVGNNGTTLHYNGTGWTSVPTGITSALNAVWGTGPSDVWAVGESGTLLHFTGTSWTSVKTGVANTLHGIWGIGASDVWAVGQWGMILHYNGTSWTPTPSYVIDSLIGVWGNSTRDVWTVGARGAMLHWDGTSWVDSSRNTETLTDIMGTSTTNAWVVGESGRILSWDGFSWYGNVGLSVPNTRINSVYTKGSAVWAVGDNGSIAQWDSTPFPQTDGLGLGGVKTAFATTRTDLWIVGAHGYVLRWNGSAWTLIPGVPSTYLQTGWGSGPNDVWIATPTDMYRWDGTKLSAIMGAPTDVQGMWGTGPNNVWAVRSDNKVFRYNGTNWISMDSGRTGSGSLYAVWGSSALDVWVGGTGLWRWNGLTWSTSVPRLPRTIDRLFGTGANDVWACGNDTIVHYNGSGWTPVSERLTYGGNAHWGVFGSSATDIWAGSSKGRLLRYDGRSFVQGNAPSTIDAITGFGTTELWLISNNGVFRR